MNSGIVPAKDVVSLAFNLIEKPEGILSIFAGGVFWESEDEFVKKCSCDREHAIERILEIRAYSKETEFHAVRDSIAEECTLSWRVVKDCDYDFYLDDVQYLDIDSSRSDAAHCQYFATGGGEYTLPIANAERVRIRNYFRYDEDGLAQAVDFRIVGLLKEGDE